MNNFRFLFFFALAYLVNGWALAEESTYQQDLLNEIEVLNLSNPNEASRLISAANLNETIKNSPSLQSHLYNVLAQKAIIQGEYDTAAQNLQYARQLARQSGNQLQEAEALRREGILMSLLEQYSQALVSLNKALELYSTIDSPKITVALESILNVYLHLQMQDKLKQFGQMLLNEATKRDFIQAVYSAHYFLAEAYLMEKEITKASFHAKHLFDPASKNQLISSVLSHAILAKIEAASGNEEEALKNIRIAKVNAKENAFTIAFPEILFEEANILLKSNKLTEAKQKFEELAEIASDTVSRNEKIKALQKLSEIYTAQSDFKNALESVRMYSQLQDQSNVDKERQLLAIHEARLGMTIKENQIKELTLEQELNTQQQQNQMIVIIISCIALLAMVIFSATVYRQSVKIKQANSALASASEAKSQFLARMSHEIRTPINAIIGLTKLCMNTGLNEQQIVNLKQIDESSQTLLVVINDILDYSKIEAGELHLSKVPFDIEEVIDRAVRLNSVKAIEKNLKLTHSISRDVPLQLMGDPQRLQQILNNLLSNAIKFTNSGNVSVSVKRKYVDEHLTLEFEVKDSGVGIELSKQTQLFESFSQADESITREYGGTGLGLAICKQLVELMGGKIWLESYPNQGSSFYFTIKPIDTINPTMVRFTPQSLKNLKVLVVDDLAISRDSIAQTLLGLNIHCDQAVDGSDGVNQFRQSVKDNAPYDLIILDWNMPGIDGIEVASVIRQEYTEKPPVIFMMASGSLDNLKALGKTVGINLYLQKPVGADALFEAIAGDSTPVLEKVTVKQNPPHIPNFSGVHILLVEDNSINRKVALAYLENTHASVSIAENGKLAIEKITHDTSIDIVLMDIQMPVMDGYSATKIIRHELKLSLPIIAMTAHAMMDEVNKSFELGMNAHVTKPIDANLLYQAIEENLVQNRSNQYQNDREGGRRSGPVSSQPNTPSRGDSSPLSAPKPLDMIDRAQAISDLLNDETAYRDITNDFVRLNEENQIPDKINTLEDLSSVQQIVHAISPTLSYIGAYNFAKHVSRLEQELQRMQLPLSENDEHKINAFKLALNQIVNKLTNSQ